MRCLWLAVEESGLCMAALTTLVRLLEMKVVEMEGEDGTGTLEEDIKLLEVCRVQTTFTCLTPSRFFVLVSLNVLSVVLYAFLLRTNEFANKSFWTEEDSGMVFHAIQSLLWA